MGSLDPLPLLPPAGTVRVYRGRLAPSPTGLLHLGHASTFLTAYARACEARGTLVLRNEDLDPQRSRPEFFDAMLEDLHWLGIDWQEGPKQGGAYGPYSQSERRDLYQAAWRELYRKGYLYPCRCSRKDLSQAASAPHEQDNEGPVYPGTCRPLLPGVRDGGRQGGGQEGRREGDASSDGLSWRFRVPDAEAIEFLDQHLGAQCFVAGRDFGDFLVWRRDGVPSYQLACVVDDAAMHITEVVRGADLLRSTARQLLLYRALGLEPPLWYHCSLVKDADGQRLAKRHHAMSVRRLREQGTTPRDVCIMLGLGQKPAL
jgi:glutamyl/glutaminyl-tRNA synthetase